MTQFESPLSSIFAYQNHTAQAGLMERHVGDQLLETNETARRFDTVDDLKQCEDSAMMHYRTGKAQQRLGQFAAAQASYTAAITKIESTRKPMRNDGLSISLMGRWQEIYEAAVQLCLEQGDVVEAFNYAEQARARAFADQLARRGNGMAQCQVTPATAPEIQATLPTGTLMLVYFAIGLHDAKLAPGDAVAAQNNKQSAYPPRLLLMALTNEQVEIYECPINPNSFQASSAFMVDGRRFLSPRLLRRYYDVLIGPVVHLLGWAKRIVIVPHGPLHHVPFVALTNAEGQALIEHAAHLSYTPSATVWLCQQATRSQQPADASDDRRSMLAVGFDGVEGRHLRHTEAEATMAADVCDGIAWRGVPGVCQQLAAAAGHYRWLHLACHGEFNLDEPLRSCLEIGPDERLCATTVMQHFNLQADLVTLSACRSGVSKVLRGDEPMGLARAFLGAGARAVLVTLWPVEDTSARLLMEFFYHAMLVQGKDPDVGAALHAAQHYLRNLTMAEVNDLLARWGEDVLTEAPDPDTQPYADPAFWAAYTLIGT
ncbi:MAG: CHAT domain-containing protein [Chloroflexales bacterium]|nr:CHAT domain-containing protein [Chloroflexales bacterium]